MAEEGTFTINEEVLRKAGLHASSYSTTEDYTNQFIKEAEGWVMSMVKKDNLVTEYSVLSSTVKELLRLITSNVAAIFVIQYDMTNFDARIDAENQMQVLWGIAIESIDALKNILIKT